MKVKEYFVRDIPEGGEYPKFFLPIARFNYKYAVEAWIFPLAIPMWLFLVIKNVGWSIWRDCMSLLFNLEKKVKNSL